MLTVTQKTRAQRAFAALEPIVDDVAALFFRRVFQLDPSMAAVFSENLAECQTRFVQMLDAVVNGPDEPDQLVAAVRGVGCPKDGCGATDEQAETFRAALLWVMETLLGREFDAEMKDTWSAVHRTLKTALTECQRRKTSVVA